jgi:amidase
VLPNRPGDAAVTMLTEGAVTRTIRDTASVLDGLAESAAFPNRLRDEVGRDPGGLRVGLCLHAFTGVDVDEGCLEAARSAARLLESLGHRVEEAWPAALYDPDLLPGATNLAAAHTASTVDAWSAVLGRELGEGDVEPPSWSLVARGRGLSGIDVMRALQRQEELTREIRGWWRDFDLLLTPTTAEPGPPLGAYKRGFAPGRGSAFTRVFNATGQPALSLPLGWPSDGLPRGVQLVAAYGRDDMLIRIGAQLEEAAPWADRRPPLG